jgi:tRNA U34 5-methylaminomethyl-2-thiouridine-forming methyltransferase MnmC
VQVEETYHLVRLANGARSLRSLSHKETFHPVIGPQAEADALYVNQLHLMQRAQQCSGEFVVWDVGLGAAANALQAIRAMSATRVQARLISFDCTLSALHFALDHRQELGYLHGFEDQITQLLANQLVAMTIGDCKIQWEMHLNDFPSLMEKKIQLPSPHLIMFDAYSPAKNPAMWTLPIFSSIFNYCRPDRPCSLATYSRSTLLRSTLLLAGFFVGTGNATGEKEETTIAANTLELIERPLDIRWLQRALRSTSAEPLLAPIYAQAPLSSENKKRLLGHAQFNHHSDLINIGLVSL